jgi:hypothetical protein
MTDQPDSESNLSLEILEITHRWYQPLLAFLLGCLLGWGISYLLPINYRAETRISVAYNADAVYSHPDDYKNWQMYQLDALVMAPEVLSETLTRLRAKDSYWDSVTEDQLRQMVHASWRNTGVWRLSATHPEEYRAANLAYNWMRVTLETYWAASQGASQMQTLDGQISALNQAEVNQQLSQTLLSRVIRELAGWQDALRQLPAEQAASDEARLQTLELAGQVEGSDPALLELIPNSPPAGSTNQATLDWLARLLPVLQNRLASSEMQSNALASQRDSLNQDYLTAKNKSRGLSALLVVSPMLDGIWQIEAIRQTGLMSLIGGLMGVLIWGGYWLIRLSVKRSKPVE